MTLPAYDQRFFKQTEAPWLIDDRLSLNISTLQQFVRSYWTPAGRLALQNLLWLLVGQGISMLANFGIVLILINNLSPADFGIYSSGFSVLAMLTVMSSSGARGLTLRHLVRKPHRSGLLMGSYVLITLITLPPISLMFCIISRINGAGMTELVYLIFISISGIGTSLAITHIYDAQHRQKIAALTAAAVDLMSVVLFGLMSLLQSVSLIEVGLLFAFKNITLAILLWILYATRFGKMTPHFRWRHTKTMLLVSLPITGAAWLASLPISGQSYLARQILGPDDLAILGAVIPFLYIFVTISSLAYRVLTPHIFADYGIEKVFVKKLLIFQVFLYLFLYLLIGSVSYVSIHYFMPAYYARCWALSIGFLVIGSVYQAGSALAFYLIRNGNYRPMLLIYLSGTTLFIVSTTLLQGRIGLWSFAAGLGIAGLSNLLLCARLLKQQTC